MQMILKSLEEKASSLLLFSTNPNIGLVEKALNLDVDDLETLSDLVISKYIIALSQYLIYFNSQANKSSLMLKLYSKKFEKDLNSKVRDVTGTRVAERKATVLEQNADLQALSEKIAYYEGEVELCKSHDEQVNTLINALKRELTRRENENSIMRRDKYDR